MENNPVAPTGEQAPASVANPTNSNEPTATPPANGDTSVNNNTQTQVPANDPTPEQIAKYLGTTPEGLEKFKKFSDNNGGFDKVFSERKKEITTPPTANIQNAPSMNDSTTQTPPVQAQQAINGLSQDYVEAKIVKDYFRDLSENPDYANIASQLRDGTVMEEASKRFGISPIKDGKINEIQLKNFCDMYSKTMPAAPANVPMTNTPTVQPTTEVFNGQINSTADALKVVQENQQLINAGKGEHPKLKEAQQFLNNGFNERHPKQKEFNPSGWRPKQ